MFLFQVWTSLFREEYLIIIIILHICGPNYKMHKYIHVVLSWGAFFHARWRGKNLVFYLSKYINKVGTTSFFFILWPCIWIKVAVAVVHCAEFSASSLLWGHLLDWTNWRIVWGYFSLWILRGLNINTQISIKTLKTVKMAPFGVHRHRTLD